MQIGSVLRFEGVCCNLPSHATLSCNQMIGKNTIYPASALLQTFFFSRQENAVSLLSECLMTPHLQRVPLSSTCVLACCAQASQPCARAAVTPALGGPSNKQRGAREPLQGAWGMRFRRVQQRRERRICPLPRRCYCGMCLTLKVRANPQLVRPCRGLMAPIAGRCCCRMQKACHSSDLLCGKSACSLGT